MTGIHLRAKVFPLAFLLYLFKPQISINGAPAVRGKWGDNSIPLPPGRYQISCWFNYIFGPANKATIVVDVQPGVVVPITYRTRWMVFLVGKIAIEGTPPAADYRQPPVYQANPGYQQGAPAYPQQPMAQPQPVASVPAGWNPDPSGRYELRYWNGQTWTEHVSTRGVTAVDPPR